MQAAFLLLVSNDSGGMRDEEGVLLQEGIDCLHERRKPVDFW